MICFSYVFHVFISPLISIYKKNKYPDGKFHKTISILRASFKYENEAQNNLCNKILEYAEQKITNVFIYIGDEALSRKAIEVDDKNYIYDEKDDAEYNKHRLLF